MDGGKGTRCGTQARELGWRRLVVRALLFVDMVHEGSSPRFTSQSRQPIAAVTPAGGKLTPPENGTSLSRASGRFASTEKRM